MINKKKKFKISENITKASFPKPTDDFLEQRTWDYGLSVARAIQGEWFKREGNNARFYDVKTEFQKRRLYAKGKQSTRKHKSRMFDGNVSFLNFDFTPIPIIPKFRSMVVNGMMDRDYSIKAKSIDRESQDERAKYREAIEKDMLTKDFNKNVKKVYGIDISQTGMQELPESQEELDIHTDLNFKPSTEIAQELAIASIMEENQYDDKIRYRLICDLFDLGIAVAKNEFSASDGIRYKYVDPENFVSSHTEDPFYDDCFYFGEFRNELISTIVKDFPHLEQDEIDRIQEASNSWGEYHGLDNYNQFEDNLDGKVAVLNFCYKTVRKKVWKEKSNKTGGRKVIKRDKDFEVKGKGDRDFEKRVKSEEIWFEGKFVLGANVMLEWGVMENQMRKKSNSNRVLSPYVAVAPNKENQAFDSMVDRMIPFADKIKIIDLKIQQVLQMTLPDGQFIDVDGLMEIDLGNGTKYTPTEALDMYIKTGSIFGRSNTYGGDFNNSKVPIQEIRHSSGAEKLMALERQYMMNVNMIKDVTGINMLDGNQRDKDSLVGLQKMMAYNSNVSTRHILTAVNQVTLGLAKLTSIRISDILEFSDRKEDFIRRIGSGSVRNLEYFNDLHLRDFAIYLDLEPDEEERARLEADIQIEIQNGNLGVEDKIDILNIGNIKYANEILKIRKKRYIKQKQEQKMQEIEAQKQANIQSAQASAQAQADKLKMEKGVEVELENIKHRNSMQKLDREYGYKINIEKMKAEYDMPKKEAELQGQMNRDKMKEDRKDERVKKEATVQSKLTKQRQEEAEPIDFEAEDELLSDFEL